MSETIYVRQTDGVITKEPFNVIPINIDTDVVLLAANSTDIADHVIDEDSRKFKYVTSTNKLTYDKATVIKSTDSIDKLSISCIIGNHENVPDKLFIGRVEENKPKMENVINNVFEKVTSENAIKFDIDSILDKEFQNKLNMSEYDHAVYDFLGNMDDRDVSLVSINRFRLVMKKSDRALFLLEGIQVAEYMRIYNIPEGILLRANSTDIDMNNKDSEGGVYLEITTEDLELEFVCTSDREVTCINPYILYV